MSAGDIFGLVVSLAVLVVPRVRALPRGAALDERAGHGPRSSSTRSSWSCSAYPLGIWMARVYTREGSDPRRARLPPRCSARDAGREQDWKAYAKSVLVFSVVFSAFLYALLRLQGHLFLNPDHLKGVPWHIALNTTASFVTNTNWQYYGGETTMSYLSQMAGLAVQNFVSAGVGMAVLAAVIRGIARRGGGERTRQLLARPLPLDRLHPAAALARARGDPALAGRRRRRSTATRPRRRSRARTRRSRAARPRRRSRSSSSARTAAASTTRTRPSRSRTRPGSRTSSSCSRSC